MKNRSIHIHDQRHLDLIQHGEQRLEDQCRHARERLNHRFQCLHISSQVQPIRRHASCLLHPKLESTMMSLSSGTARLWLPLSCHPTLDLDSVLNRSQWPQYALNLPITNVPHHNQPICPRLSPHSLLKPCTAPCSRCQPRNPSFLARHPPSALHPTPGPTLARRLYSAAKRHHTRTALRL